MYCFHILEISYKMSLHFVMMNTEHDEYRTIPLNYIDVHLKIQYVWKMQITLDIFRIYNIPEINEPYHY